MQKKILPLFFLLCTCLLNAQDAGLNWATGTGSSAVDEGRAITSDVNGNVYTVGHFEGSADFDPGLGSLVLTSAGIGDVFVQKLDADGNLLWARRVGGSRNERANAVSVDGSGNVYVTGSFEETVDFDPGMGMEELTATDGAHVYVLKLDANGDFVWAKDIESRGTGLGIAATADGSVYVTGGFQQPLSIDGSTIFVQRLDASGAMSWEAIMGGTSVDEGTGVAVDGSGNAYVTGRFSTTVDFDPGMTELNITAEGGQDVFVQKFSPSGGMLWVRTFGGDGVDWARGIAVDADDNAYVTGSFQQTVDFDPGAGTTELTSSDFENMFVHKLDEMGAFVWVRQNEGLCTGESIAVGNNGEVYSTGYFRGPVDFDPGTDELELQSTFAFEDAFIQRLDADGNLVWVKQIGGVDTEGKGVAADASGNVYVTGFFSGMVDFDPGSGTTNIGSVAASVDVFSVKLQSCSSSSASLMVDACGTYTSPTGQIITQSGTYTETISNAMGCDSVITINLTVTNLTANVSVSGSTLTANPDGASYQWIDCNNNDQAIDGATDQSYTPSASGDYAVIVSQNACVDTSVCFSVVVTNVADGPRAKAPLVFPNPSRGQVTIALGSLTEASVEVFNVHGQLIFRNEAVRDELYPFELEASPGMYLIRVRTKEQQWNYKLLRQ